MHILAGPYFAVAALLVLAGAHKVVRPGAAVLALGSVGARVPSWMVRVGALAECVVGFAAIFAGGALPATGVAASYAGFAVFVVVAFTKGGVVSSCGCFGKADTPPTGLHVAVNVACSALATSYATGSTLPLRDVVGEQPLAGAPFLAITGLCVWFVYLTLAMLPGLISPSSRHA